MTQFRTDSRDGHVYTVERPKRYYMDTQGQKSWVEVPEPTRTAKVPVRRRFKETGEFVEFEMGDPTRSYYFKPEGLRTGERQSVAHGPGGLASEEVEAILGGTPEGEKALTEAFLRKPYEEAQTTAITLPTPESEAQAQGYSGSFTVYGKNVPGNVLDIIDPGRAYRRDISEEVSSALESGVIPESREQKGRVPSGAVKEIHREGKEREYMGAGLPSSDPNYNVNALKVRDMVRDREISAAEARGRYGVSLKIERRQHAEPGKPFKPTWEVDWMETADLRRVANPKGITFTPMAVQVGSQSLTPEQWKEFQEYQATQGAPTVQDSDIHEFTARELKDFLSSSKEYSEGEAPPRTHPRTGVKMVY